jgi:hypothetical protein
MFTAIEDAEEGGLLESSILGKDLIGQVESNSIG